MTSFSVQQSLTVLAAEGGGMDYSMVFVMIGIGIMFYFLIIRPEQKRRKEQEARISELKKNDRIVTVGGILGTVVHVGKNADEIVIRIDENNNTRMHILRSAVSKIVNEGKAGDSDKSG